MKNVIKLRASATGANKIITSVSFCHLWCVTCELKDFVVLGGLETPSRLVDCTHALRMYFVKCVHVTYTIGLRQL